MAPFSKLSLYVPSITLSIVSTAWFGELRNLFTQWGQAA